MIIAVVWPVDEIIVGVRFTSTPSTLCVHLHGNWVCRGVWLRSHTHQISLHCSEAMSSAGRWNRGKYSFVASEAWLERTLADRILSWTEYRMWCGLSVQRWVLWSGDLDRKGRPNHIHFISQIIWRCSAKWFPLTGGAVSAPRAMQWPPFRCTPRHSWRRSPVFAISATIHG